MSPAAASLLEAHIHMTASVPRERKPNLVDFDRYPTDSQIDHDSANPEQSEYNEGSLPQRGNPEHALPKA
jgi:hypothetical protein